MKGIVLKARSRDASVYEIRFEKITITIKDLGELLDKCHIGEQIYQKLLTWKTKQCAP